MLRVQNFVVHAVRASSFGVRLSMFTDGQGGHDLVVFCLFRSSCLWGLYF